MWRVEVRPLRKDVDLLLRSALSGPTRLNR